MLRLLFIKPLFVLILTFNSYILCVFLFFTLGFRNYFWHQSDQILNMMTQATSCPDMSQSKANIMHFELIPTLLWQNFTNKLVLSLLSRSLCVPVWDRHLAVLLLLRPDAGSGLNMCLQDVWPLTRCVKVCVCVNMLLWTVKSNKAFVSSCTASPNIPTAT